MNLIIRQATVHDINALHALIESAYRGESARAGWTHEADLLDGQRIDRDGLAEILDNPSQHLLVADRPDVGLIGCVQVTDRDDGFAYLGLLSVSPSSQATGLGRQLITAAEDFARDQLGAKGMEMTVIQQRGELIAYYERRGYRQTGETRPFPYGDERFGKPRTDALGFVVLAKVLT